MGSTESLPTWSFIVIGVCSFLLVVAILLCIWRYCCNSRRRNKSFAWLDRLGIPLAKEGSPDQNTLPRSGLHSKYVVKGPVRIEITGQRNGTFDEDVDDDIDGDLSGISKDDDDPFKRLGQLGIPRAKVERNHSDAQEGNTLRRMKPPPTPLPSVLSDSSSQYDLSSNPLPSPPVEMEYASDSLPSPPPELTDDASDLSNHDCCIEANYAKITR